MSYPLLFMCWSPRELTFTFIPSTVVEVKSKGRSKFFVLEKFKSEDLLRSRPLVWFRWDDSNPPRISQRPRSFHSSSLEWWEGFLQTGLLSSDALNGTRVFGPTSRTQWNHPHSYDNPVLGGITGTERNTKMVYRIGRRGILVEVSPRIRHYRTIGI